MTVDQALTTVDRLRGRSAEAEWYEFKRNRAPQSERFGWYLAGLANAAALAHKRYGYLILGIDDDTHEVAGTDFDPYTEKVNGQDLLHYLSRGLDPRLAVSAQEADHPSGGRVVVIEVEATSQRPASFLGKEKIRVGTSLTDLSEHPSKARALWNLQTDWSAQMVDGATLADLHPEAIDKARREFAEKNPHQTDEIAQWDDETFLNKARVTIRGDITHAALLLLGRPEAASLLSPAVAKVSWILKDAENQEVDYAHFGPPFILQVDRLLSKIRNLTLRELPGGTLFPNEVQHTSRG